MMKYFGLRTVKSPSPNTSRKRTMAPATYPDEPSRKKIAIVGSGCAGMGAAWALKDSDCEVHVFEKSSRLGGHTNTQQWQHGDERIPVDTGFIVMNTATYPNFMRFLDEVGVEIKETEMTFGVTRDHGEFEWSGEPKGIFAQRRNLFRPRHWKMIFDIIRFNQFALDLLADDSETRPGWTESQRRYTRETPIGAYLDREGYSRAFQDDYLIPMTAAVWSTSPDKASFDFPAETLIRFMWNHHLLSTIATRPVWLTIPGGSQRYIDAVVRCFSKDRLQLHTSCEVMNVLRPSRGEEGGGVSVSWKDAETGRIDGDVFDHVILACHGDEILPLLAKHGSSMSDRTNSSPRQADGHAKASSKMQYVSQQEIDIFSAFQTTENIAYLHSDLRLMPKRRDVWTSWNYLVQTPHPSQSAHPAGVSLTYCMNILQHIPESTYGPVLVTMNPDAPPAAEKTQGKFIYRHPLYTSASVAAQKQLRKIQNTRGVSYCGAWTNYGFHEDGFSSGLKVAIEHLGAEIPFEFTDSTYSRGHRPELGWRDYVLRIFLLIFLAAIRILDWVVGVPGITQVVALLEQLATGMLDTAEYARLL